MNKTSLITACMMTLLALFISHQTVLAHESITVGDYEIEIGWVNEPPVAGQLNGIEIHVSNTSSGEPVEDISALVATLSYGDQSRELTLEPLGEDSPGQFEAVVLPTIPGQYTVTFGGQLGDTPVDAHVEPEEVAPVDTIQFPSSYPAPETQSADRGVAAWLIWLSLLVGLIGVGLGVTALRKK